MSPQEFVEELRLIWTDMSNEPNLDHSESKAAKHLDGVFTEMCWRLENLLEKGID